MPKPIVWLLEDQLSPDLEILKEHPDSPVLLIESAKNFSALRYHKKRLIFQIAAMRHFRDELEAAGRTVLYYELKPKGYRDSLTAIRHAVSTTKTKAFVVVDPSEHHTRAWMNTLPKLLKITIDFSPNTLFLTHREEFAAWATPLKSPVMEIFYRKMRAKHEVLMQNNSPIGGNWNFDKLNRKPFDKHVLVPPVPNFKPDEITQAAIEEVDRRFPSNPGHTADFNLPVTRHDAEKAFHHFIKTRLPLFGEFEDAMAAEHEVLFHAFISPQLNAGLLDPMQCIRAAEKAYHKGQAPLNAAEGFIRQILGWREFVYGIYHTYMPEYKTRNTRKASRPLPQFFWDAKTEMNCIRHVVNKVIKTAYSHHIERLMVLCNFATLAGLSPQAVNDWFLEMYADSHDWVVTPNVIGMGMNADHDTIATKPYISSANYINKMSDYCEGCKYNPKLRTGPEACPFNYLYWTFLNAQKKPQSRNPRMQMILKNLEKIPEKQLATMREQSQEFLDKMPKSTY